ncbi:MAG TPA: hypothetical protein VMC02_11800 [Steroidobacteraceae bacterium]|nr:hypothetical protein [Steroidobacteraceae bacterium]
MSLELFRTGHDMWGRPVLEGVSWSLIWLALAAGVAIIIGHQLYRLFRRGRSGGP